MRTDKQPDCILEQWQNGKYSGQTVLNGPFEGYKPFWDVVAITKVYLKPCYKEELQNEFQYSY